VTVSVNGKSIEAAHGANVVWAVGAAGHDGGFFGIAVALNGEVVPRSAWDRTTLSEGDKVEVLVAAQGG
jgi:sulfur carrier protein